VRRSPRGHSDKPQFRLISVVSPPARRRVPAAASLARLAPAQHASTRNRMLLRMERQQAARRHTAHVSHAAGDHLGVEQHVGRKACAGSNGNDGRSSPSSERLRSGDPLFLRFFLCRNAYFCRAFLHRGGFFCGFWGIRWEFSGCRGDVKVSMNGLSPASCLVRVFAVATIRSRKQADGTTRYTAIVRLRRGKTLVHQEASHTFAHRSGCPSLGQAPRRYPGGPVRASVSCSNMAHRRWPNSSAWL